MHDKDWALPDAIYGPPPARTLLTGRPAPEASVLERIEPCPFSRPTSNGMTLGSSTHAEAGIVPPDHVSIARLWSLGIFVPSTQCSTVT